MVSGIRKQHVPISKSSSGPRSAVVVIKGRSNPVTTFQVVHLLVLSAVAYPVFVVGVPVSVGVLQRRFRKMWNIPIPFGTFGYPDLVSFLATIRGVVVSRNATNNLYQVSKDENVDPSTLMFGPNCRLPEDGQNIKDDV